MRYHYIKPEIYQRIGGRKYYCNHELYSECTLFKFGDKGLAVIQQRFNKRTKQTYWSSIDEWLISDIYLNCYFRIYFDKYADTPNNYIYPTVTIRQIMWALKMKPIKRERWETVFDRCPI